ncbi:hypothetical protein [Arcticibacter tournemirensis]|uniref:Uncharacterized protein n=1 Tax=Arcticibacter tournemirensis TaxID=699437 RepID=A0A4Q0MA33_9SPHI|nr:hypothetical protein [Arcticibacter tournemirensis]RXF70098.1 hypothetical protein EKH83_09435 [Arcticibacter tournemirensis]
MYTTTIGHTFLKEYNRRNGTDYSAKLFFDEVYFRLFFDDPKYLMWAQNSPFVQGISKKKPYFERHERLENLSQFHQKVTRGERDASIAIGYPASETKEYATTSGLVSDINLEISEEATYLSWIGSSLSIGVSGGYAILFNDPAILYATFEGWKVYREYLNDVTLERLRPNQIFTWNGQWLTYRFSWKFRSDFDFLTLQGEKFFTVSETEIGVNTIEWSKLFFSLSRQFPDSIQTGYVFSLGQTNKTLGFFPFHFKSGSNLVSVYKKLWGEDDYLKNTAAFESLIGKRIDRACELGAIGLQALEPRGLTKYFSEGNIDLSKPAILLKKNETEIEFEERKSKILSKDLENIITFQTYKTWLIAMLTKNKEEIADYTTEIAAALVRYRASARKTDRKNLIEKELFASSKKNAFIEALIKIVSDGEVDSDIIEKVKELKDYIHYLNNEEFVYFWLLLKFDYAYQERIS